MIVYELLRKFRGVFISQIFLLCNTDFFEMCVCMYPPHCRDVGLVSVFAQKYQKCHLVWQINGPRI